MSDGTLTQSPDNAFDSWANVLGSIADNGLKIYNAYDRITSKDDKYEQTQKANANPEQAKIANATAKKSWIDFSSPILLVAGGAILIFALIIIAKK